MYTPPAIYARKSLEQNVRTSKKASLEKHPVPSALPSLISPAASFSFSPVIFITSQTWNTAYYLHNLILQILLYTTLLEHFQCNMREHFNILHQIQKMFTSIACVLAHYSMSVISSKGLLLDQLLQHHFDVTDLFGCPGRVVEGAQW